MSFFDSLLGRTRPAPSRLEQLFAMSTAYITLQAKLELRSSGGAGICFKPVTSSVYGQTEREIDDLLKVSSGATGSKIRTITDEFGFRWIVVEDPDFEDLVTTIHMVSQTLQENGFGDQLLAALFQFLDSRNRPLFWVYSYKRGKFYPFVPAGSGTQRDNASELHLRSVMEGELPIEPDLERWYPLWGIPL